MTTDPVTVEEIFKDYSSRHAAILRALTHDVDALYGLCDPEKENLCLYGHPNGSWEVKFPEEELPPELPEPAVGINFAREGLERKEWLSLVAVNSDSWLLSVAFFFGARLNLNERKRLFDLINDLPIIYKVVSGSNAVNDKSSSDSRCESKASGINRSANGHAKSTPKQADESLDEEDDTETPCGICGGNYVNSDEFWIGCDICEGWYHGNCVRITPAGAESIIQYKCPSCAKIH